MNWTPATERPKTPGYYVVRLHLSERPIVLWWSLLSTQWRNGARIENVTSWLGPL